MSERINWKFVIAGMLGIFICCLQGPLIYSDEGTISVISAVLHYYDTQRLWIDSYHAFATGISAGKMYLLLPVAATIATVPYICDELNSAYHWNIIGRTGVDKYIRKSCITVLIGAVFVVVGGLVLYSAFTLIVFPKVPDYGDFALTDLSEVEQVTYISILWQEVPIFLQYCFRGMAMAFASYVLAVLTQDKYVVLCVPFLLNYIGAEYLAKYIWSSSLEIMLGAFVITIFVWSEKRRRLLI